MDKGWACGFALLDVMGRGIQRGQCDGRSDGGSDRG